MRVSCINIIIDYIVIVGSLFKSLNRRMFKTVNLEELWRLFIILSQDISHRMRESMQ